MEQVLCIVAGQCLTRVLIRGEPEQAHGVCPFCDPWLGRVDRKSVNGETQRGSAGIGSDQAHYFCLFSDPWPDRVDV